VADEAQIPNEEQLREALEQVRVSDILVNALSAAASIGFHRVSDEARDLDQVRLAIESLRALDPVLREAGVDEAVVRDLEQARTNLQLAYAKAVAASPAGSSLLDEGASDDEESDPEGDDEEPRRHEGPLSQ
jgi:hypothetical protein